MHFSHFSHFSVKAGVALTLLAAALAPAALSGDDGRKS